MLKQKKMELTRKLQQLNSLTQLRHQLFSILEMEKSVAYEIAGGRKNQEHPDAEETSKLADWLALAIYDAEHGCFNPQTLEKEDDV